LIPLPLKVAFWKSIRLTAAKIFAGRIKIKNKIVDHPAYTLNSGIKRLIPSIISITPVISINSVLKGICGGIIIAIPLVKTKCAIAVKQSMTHIAILAAKSKLYSLVTNFMKKFDSKKTEIRTINGFILSVLLVLKLDLNKIQKFID
jgi:hypothetical protein